jgi:hypothetical protein
LPSYAGNPAFDVGMLTVLPIQKRAPQVLGKCASGFSQYGCTWGCLTAYSKVSGCLAAGRPRPAKRKFISSDTKKSFSATAIHQEGNQKDEDKGASQPELPAVSALEEASHAAGAATQARARQAPGLNDEGKLLLLNLHGGD